MKNTTQNVEIISETFMVKLVNKNKTAKCTIHTKNREKLLEHFKMENSKKFTKFV
jgi:hypothetical protein